MNNQYANAVKLLKTNKYHTYQFYGELQNQNTKAEDGLKIAALTCFEWLRNRLEGNRIPDELLMPSKDEYEKVKDEDLRSFNFSDDFIIDVEADLEEDIWALRIFEKDLGALSDRDPVAGRTIQSDIAFRVVENKLQCGFRTTVSDKENVDKADCVRFSLIKEFCNDPLFGLKQIEKIFDPDHMDLCDDDRLNSIYSVYSNKDNQLPLLIYTYDDFSEDNGVFGFRNMDMNALSKLQKESVERNVLSRAVPYANRYAGIARAYFLPKRMFEKFNGLFGIGSYTIGDVLVIDPKKFGGRVKIYSYDDKNSYQNYVINYTRDRDIDFKDVLFADEAKIIIDRKNDDYKNEILTQLDETTRNLESIKSKFNRAERINEYKKNESSDNGDELEDALNMLQKSENTVLVLDKELKRLKSELSKKDAYIAYVNRRLTRPLKHSMICDWIRDYKYLVLDKKAVDCLNRNDAENVDINVVCDSLDYLENLYSQYLFEGMDKEELNIRSSDIYNRPFEVSPSGIPVSARGECKIKYTFEDGIRREYPLDWHLKAGNHGELIRIYFIIDKDKKKIVVGSLPNHLVY